MVPTAGRHDLRLVPAALGGWAVVLCGLHLGPMVAAGIGAVSLLVAAAAALRAYAPAILAMAGVVSALALVIGAQTWQVEHHPLRAAAARGSAATVTVYLRDDPRAVASPGYGGRRPEPQQVVIRAELESAQIAGQQWRTGGRVIVFAPAGGWTGLLPGQRVRATGVLAIPDRPDLTVAVLRVRGGPQVLSAPTAVQRVAGRLRSGLRLSAGVLDPEPAGLLPALVVGDTSAMVPAVHTVVRYTLLGVSPANTPHRALLYGRVSRANPDTKSVADQLTELRAWARRQRWTVVAEHSDDGISASRYANGKRRPGWQSAMDLITAGKVDLLAVWEISRATRDRAVWSALVAACLERDVKIGAGGKVHDPSDPDDGFMLDLTGALAVRESSVTSKRVKRAAESRATAGKPHGALPFGYRRVCDSATGQTLRWEEHPEQAPVVVEIVRRLLARESAYGIARDLNQRGIRTGRGKQWAGSTVAKLARRPAYAGLRDRDGRVLEGVRGTWPALVTGDEHFRLLALYADPERDKWRNSEPTKHLGTGLYRCGRKGCDGRMRVVVDAARPNRYDCRACHRVSRLQDSVDEWVVAVLTARLARPDVLELLTEAADDPAREAAAEVTRLRAKLTQARALVDADRLSLESLADLEARALPRIAAAQRRARPRQLPASVVEVAGVDAEASWAAASIADRRAILDALMIVTILPGQRFALFDRDSVRIEWRH